MVVLDSLNGYVNAMPQEDFLHLHLHELLGYLNQRGVVTDHGSRAARPRRADGHARGRELPRRHGVPDALLRGARRAEKAVSVVKKRSGFHEQTIRGFTMTKDGIVVGEPLLEFQGVMTGVPQFLGDARQAGIRPRPRESPRGHAERGR
jgi:circadian clock protein KaiC